MATAIETIRRVRIEGSTSGLDKVAGDLRLVADAQKAVEVGAAPMAVATDTAAKKVTSSAGAFNALMQRIEPTIRAQRDFERGQRTVNSALEQGVASTEKAARATQLLEDRFRGIADRLSLQAQQIGKAFNEDLVASFAGSGKSASASASVFAAEFDRLDTIAAQKAQQIGQTFRQNLDASFSGGSGKRASDSASIFMAVDRDAEMLRAQIDPLGTAQARLNAELARYSELAKVGQISTAELAQAQALAQSRFAQTSLQIQQTTRYSGRFNMQMSQMSFQLNDIASGIAMGQSPFTILAQQGGQVLQVLQMGEGGVTGSLKNFGNAIKSLGVSALALVTPMNAALVGVAALGAGFLAYSALSQEELPSIDEALKSHTDLISRIKGAYGEAAVAADVYGRESKAVLTAGLQADIRALEAQAKAATDAFYNSISAQQSRTRSGMGPRVVGGEFRPFADQIEALRSGAQDAGQFRDAIAKAISSEPVDSEVRKTGEKLLTLTDPLAKIDASLGRAKGTLADFGDVATTTASGVTSLAKAMSDLANIGAAQLGPEVEAYRSYIAALSQARGRTARDDATAAYQDALQRLNDARVPTPRARPNLADFDPSSVFTEGYKAAEERLRQLTSEVENYGKGAAAVEAYRMQQEVLTAVAKSGNEVTDEQAAKLRALTKVYETLVLVRERSKVEADLKFQRDQIGRSPIEQQVAAQQRALYGDGYALDMNDALAGMARQNAALKALDDAARSSRDSLESVALQLRLIGAPAEVKAREEALLAANQNIRQLGLDGTAAADQMRGQATALADANTILSRQTAAWEEVQNVAGNAIDTIVDGLISGNLSADTFLGVLQDIGKELATLAIINPLKNELLGANLPVLGDVMDRLRGKPATAPGLADALASSVASMNVSAGVVTINGGVASGLTGTASDVVKRATGIGSDAVAGKITGLNDNFKGSLSTMIADAKAAGFDISVNSGFRSVERQQQLWQGALAKYGSPEAARKWVAPPGRSMHNFGMAADLGYGSSGAADWAHENAGKYGLKFPLSNENWHVEPIGARAQVAGRSLQDMAAAAKETATATKGLGNGINDLSQSVTGAANQIGKIGGAVSTAIPGFDGLGAVLGGGYTTATGYLYADGGYTGPGGRNQPAGVVHRGEVVWSQDDIARAGGVGVVEGMRRGLRGYADGGIVDMLAYARARGSQQASSPQFNTYFEDHSTGKKEVRRTDTQRADGGRDTRYVLVDAVESTMSAGSKVDRNLSARGARIATAKR